MARRVAKGNSAPRVAVGRTKKERTAKVMGETMSRGLVNAICRSLPGAKVSDPWGGGHEAWKVGGKMFACIGAVTPGVSVKTDSIETAQMLIDAGIGVKAPYFHRSWVNLPWGTAEDELRHRLATSYRLVRSSLPKKVQAELGSFV
jgi:predicted DNA-binding protein (MmcQ/YjbR family)